LIKTLTYTIKPTTLHAILLYLTKKKVDSKALKGKFFLYKPSYCMKKITAFIKIFALNKYFIIYEIGNYWDLGKLFNKFI